MLAMELVPDAGWLRGPSVLVLSRVFQRFVLLVICPVDGVSPGTDAVVDAAWITAVMWTTLGLLIQACSGLILQVVDAMSSGMLMLL